MNVRKLSFDRNAGYHGTMRLFNFTLGLLIAASACRRESEPEAGSSPAADAVDTAAATDAAEHAHGGTGAAKLLLPIMQKLGTDMTALTYGLMTDSAALVAASAAAIAEHVPIAPGELERIHGVLGDEMAEFERLDAAVHQASVKLHQAADAGRTDEVLGLLNEVQRGCVACHTRFRTRLLTNPSR